ncbi:MAG: efflux RND transporter permease subunit [Dorea sp.]|nr:efflux RND transporter permease subunit [Dorea sp.]
MTRFCVKRPYTVLVGVIMVLVLGYVSFTHLTTDLLPKMELPYVVVFTVDPGSTPEKMEVNVSQPLEESLGTVSGVENVISTSNENFSMIMLEFAEGSDMNGAMVRLNSALEQVKDALPDTASTPIVVEISMDMLSSFTVSVDVDGYDIYELSDYVKEEIIPEFERQEGVASVSGTGIVTKSVEVRLDQKKIDDINDKILGKTDSKLADAKKELDSAKAEIDSQRSKVNGSNSTLQSQQKETFSQLAKFQKMMDEAVATSASYTAQLQGLETSKTALTAEKAAYESQVLPAYQQINEALAAMHMGSISSIVADKTQETYNQLVAALQMAAQFSPDAAALLENLSWDNLVQMDNAVNTRIPQIDTELANLETEIAAARMAKDAVDDAVKEAKDNYEKVQAQQMSAVAAFGSAGGQIAAAQMQLADAASKVESAQKEYDSARETALKNANIDSLVTMSTLSSILTAENFDMPAGYITNGDDEYILKVGEEFETLEELMKLVLCKIDGVGNVRLQDVANITIIDDADQSYAKVNGNDAILLNIAKTSTAGTSVVSNAINKAIQELEEENEALHITTFMDQGHYIKIIVKSVLSNLIFGAILAILVLAIFLKDLRPTVVVAFSIPFSVLFAIVLMYFSNLTLNIISLSGLALGVGMLVDNSIVVIENIYRFKGEGLTAPQAAVKGANQVAGAVFSSTLTTVSVFLPIVFASGLAKQLLVDMALTIAYSLGASLLVALTVVPAMSSTVLKNTKPKKQPLFDMLIGVYRKLLRFCLKLKIVPIAISVALLILAGILTVKTGLTLIPNMAGEVINVSMTVPDKTSREDAYKMADDLLDRFKDVENIKTIGAMTSSTTASMISGSFSSAVSNYNNYSYYVIPEDADQVKMTKLGDDLKAAVEGFEGEVIVTATGMDMTSSLGSGMQIDITGKKLDKILEISEDIENILGEVEGFENISNGQENAAESLKIVVNKNKAMKYGLTVAQIYGELAQHLQTEAKSTILSIEDGDYQVVIVDENHELEYKDLMSYEFETTSMDENGAQVTETHKLKEFAKKAKVPGVQTIRRRNLVRTISVTADTMKGYNTSLLARDVKEKLADYEIPDGYTVEIAGESLQIEETMTEMLKMIALAIVFIYLIMVAQFQSLLSPFIIIFTIPLAFTGGLLALIFTGSEISMLSMMGLLVLAGVVVNNGIVFVDYVNQLRFDGWKKHDALVEAGVTRMRPILMTALTTILAMTTMFFSKDMGSEMGRGMAIVVIGGLTYATFMTLFIVPVLYDIFYRKKKMERIEVDV